MIQNLLKIYLSKSKDTWNQLGINPNSEQNRKEAYNPLCPSMNRKVDGDNDN